MNEEMNNNQENQNPTVNEEIQPQVTVEQTSITTPPVEETPVVTPEPPKKNNLFIPIIIILVLLLGVGAFLFFGTDIFKSKSKANNEENTETPTTEDLAIKYEGIYAAENDKLYIRKVNETTINYVVADSFFGTAKVSKDSAVDNKLSKDEYFEFKLVDDGIEVIYHADENTEILADTGLYKKVSSYSKENLYKEAVGDPKYLETNYNGVYKYNDNEYYVYQISDKEVMVKSSPDVTDPYFIDALFEETVNETNGETYFVSKSFFDEDKIAYSLIFFDNSFELHVYEDVLEYDEEDKNLEQNYKFDRKITQEDILSNFYTYY